MVPGVGEHVEDVALGLGGVEPVADVRGAERAPLLPVRLPPRLDLVVRVRPAPRLHLRLPLVGVGVVAGAGAAAEAEAGSARREAAKVECGGEGGRPRVEAERRVRGESHRGLGRASEVWRRKYEGERREEDDELWDKVLEFPTISIIIIIS